MRAFGVDADTVAYYVASNEARRLPYDQFRALHSKPLSTYPEMVREHLPNKFLELSYKKMKAHWGDLADLGLQENAVRTQLAQATLGCSYMGFRRIHGVECFQDRMVFTETAVLLKEQFLKMPYPQMVHPDLAEDRLLLGISEEEIKRVVNERAGTQPYLEFRKENLLALKERVLSKETVERFGQELQEFLKGKSYATIKEYESERKGFGISDEWVADQIRGDLNLSYLEFERKHGIAPVQDGVLGREDIIRLRTSFISFLQTGHYQKLVGRENVWDLLDCNAMLDDLSSALKREISRINSYEQLRARYPALIFTVKLLQGDDVKELIQGFFRADPYWKRAEEPYGKEMLERGLVPKKIRKAIAKAAKKVAKAKRAKETAMRAAESTKLDREREAQARYDRRVAESNEIKASLSANSTLEQARKQLKKAECKVEEVRQTVEELKKGSSDTRRRLEQKRAELRELQGNTAAVESLRAKVEGLEAAAKSSRETEVIGLMAAIGAIASESQAERELKAARAALVQAEERPGKIKELEQQIRYLEGQLEEEMTFAEQRRNHGREQLEKAKGRVKEREKEVARLEHVASGKAARAEAELRDLQRQYDSGLFHANAEFKDAEPRAEGVYQGELGEINRVFWLALK